MFYLVKGVAILIAVIAAGMSATHIVELGQRYELGPWSLAMPLLIDGLAIIASLARGNDRFPAKAQAAAPKVLALAGAASIGANIAAGHNIGQRIAGVAAVLAYVVAEWFVSQMSHKAAAAMVARADADAELAAAMATAAAAMATAVAATERRLQAEAAELVAEAERATRDAVTAQYEAERAAATLVATPARVAAAKPATVANLATARAANGQASAAAAAILAATPDMATDEVAALSGASERTVRRVRSEMRAAAMAS